MPANDIHAAATALLPLFAPPSCDCWCMGAGDRTSPPVNLCVCQRNAIVLEELRRLLATDPAGRDPFRP